MENNGMSVFCHHSTDRWGNSRLEMMSTDYVTSDSVPWMIVAVMSFIAFGLASAAWVVLKQAVRLVRKVRGSARECGTSDRQILLQQTIYGVSGIILPCLLMISLYISHALTVFSCIAVAALAAASVTNAVLLLRAVHREKPERGARIRCVAWALLGVYYALFVVTFELYNYWQL